MQRTQNSVSLSLSRQTLQQTLHPSSSHCTESNRHLVRLTCIIPPRRHSRSFSSLLNLSCSTRKYSDASLYKLVPNLSLSFLSASFFVLYAITYISTLLSQCCFSYVFYFPPPFHYHPPSFTLTFYPSFVVDRMFTISMHQ